MRSAIAYRHVLDESRLVKRNAFHTAFPRSFHLTMQLDQCLIVKAVNTRFIERSLVDQATQVVKIPKPANAPENAIPSHAVDDGGLRRRY